ncbi:hypothetical protein O3M35_000517 [Rhynocoris fuscipes]|uniref:Large ribosomal subunit protein mL44 n=1 Tax=Rhynocoris fuscipes TaxID=488301 RepID=A0AAW1DM17_9HEMI
MNIAFRGLHLALATSFRSHNNFRSFHRWVRPTLQQLYHKKKKMGPFEPNPRSEYLEWNYESELYSFGKRIGEEFHSSLLKNALIEKSYIVKEEERQRAVGIEPDSSVKDNSNMAVDGEKIISSYVTQYLETTLPCLPKKYIRNLKEYLLSEEILARVSKGIGIDDIVLCADYPVTNCTLARTLKSVVQALALSSGIERANGFVRDLIIVELVGKDLTEFCTPENPLDTLQTLLKEIGAEPAEPRLITEAGRNTLLASYQVGIYSDKKMIGRGFGESISTAVDMAACDSLWRKWGINSQRRPFPFKLELPPKLTAGSCQ